MLKRRNIWYLRVLFAHSDLFIHIYFDSPELEIVAADVPSSGKQQPL